MAHIRKQRYVASQIKDFKNEVHNLDKELTEEQLKVKALSEEIDNPINVHRWRKLEATDNETYELMTKIHTLQKRLIAKTEEVKQKNQQIEAKDKILKELKQIMQRQPTIEEAKMIPVYQQSLSQKGQQMKAMVGELQMYQNQVNEYKYEIERLEQQLHNQKKKYFGQKKREQQDKDYLLSQKPQVIQINLPEKRFVGGGFNLGV